jgi:hypothetical protein
VEGDQTPLAIASRRRKNPLDAIWINAVESSFRWVTFHITKHQALRLAERDLSLENVKNVVRYPDSVEDLSRGRHGGSLKRFKKAVDDRTLVVIAEVKRTDCWLATSFYEF